MANLGNLSSGKRIRNLISAKEKGNVIYSEVYSLSITSLSSFEKFNMVLNLD